MEATTRWRSSKDAVFLDEHLDGSTASDVTKDVDSLGGDDVEGRFGGVVVEKSRLS